MLEERDGVEMLLQAVRWVVQADPALFHHYLPLRVELLLVEDAVTHPVRLDRQRRRPRPFREVELESGEVVEGEGVVGAPVLVSQPIDLPLGEPVRALEEEMFQEMRHARGARRL